MECKIKNSDILWSLVREIWNPFGPWIFPTGKHTAVRCNGARVARMDKDAGVCIYTLNG